MSHEVKCWPQFFEAVALGLKTFDVRANDREPPYRVLDELCLREWLPKLQTYTGRMLVRRIVYVLPGGIFGVESGYVVLGLAPL